MTVLNHTVTEDEAGKRLDVLLSSLTEYSRQQIQTWIKDKLVYVNEKHVKASYKCEAGDRLSWTVPEEEHIEVKPEDIPLQILYEDNDILVINKMKGMLTHPTQTVHSGTLVNALLHHTDSLSDLGGPERLGIVHRLDKDTSGLLIIAKNNDTHTRLIEQFKQRDVFRQYEAIVHGVLAHESGIINAPIGRNPNHRLEMTVIESGKEAETHFSVIKRYRDHTHVRCELKTGRTHQIRVHMKHIGHPIVGDLKYGYRRAKKLKGHLLFAQKIGFNHPKSGEWMTFTIDRPPHFTSMLQRLENMT